MNKYQEALEIVKHYYVSNEAPKSIALLQELVDRATPKKVIIELVNGLNGGKCVEVSCNHCKKVFALLSTYDNMPKDKMRNFCSYCGQSLEWEQGEKK